MILMDRMVLLLIEMAPEGCLGEANLQLVVSLLSKRYSLQLENGQFCRSLASLKQLHIERGPSGLRLGDGGLAELEEMNHRQAPFCRKFREVAEPIIKRCTSHGRNQ